MEEYDSNISDTGERSRGRRFFCGGHVLEDLPTNLLRNFGQYRWQDSAQSR